MGPICVQFSISFLSFQHGSQGSPEDFGCYSNCGSRDGHPVLAESTLVSFINEPHNCTASIDTHHTQCTLPSTQASGQTPPIAQAKVACSESIKQFLFDQQFSEAVVQVMLEACSDSTYKQYETYWKKWRAYLNKWNPDPSNITLGFCLNFLESFRQESEASFSAMNSARAALSHLLFIGGKPFGEHPFVHRYFAGIRNICPHAPKYDSMWDPAIVLRHLETYPDFEDLSLKQLTYKTLALILLATGQRVQTMAHIMVPNIHFIHPVVHIAIASKLKHTKKTGLLLEIRQFPRNPSLCPVKSLTAYLHRTKPLRQTQALFLCHIKPFGPASGPTLSRWVKAVLQEAGLDTGIFQAHSVRSASCSAAKRGGPP